MRLLRSTKSAFGEAELLLYNKIEHIWIKISPYVDSIFEVIGQELINLKAELDRIKDTCPDPDNCECIAMDSGKKVCIHKDFGLDAFYIEEYLPYCPKEYINEKGAKTE